MWRIYGRNIEEHASRSDLDFLLFRIVIRLDEIPRHAADFNFLQDSYAIYAARHMLSLVKWSYGT
jgi:hypothetical protein